MPFQHREFDTTLHQCSACQYTSAIRQNALTHIVLHCPTADLLTAKCTVASRPRNSTVAAHGADNDGAAGTEDAVAEVTDDGGDDGGDDGYVYLVSCPNDVYTKYGRWSGKLQHLKNRYSTYYGDPRITAVKVRNAVAVETKIKHRMRSEGFGKREVLQNCDAAAVRRIFFEELLGCTIHEM